MPRRDDDDDTIRQDPRPPRPRAPAADRRNRIAIGTTLAVLLIALAGLAGWWLAPVTRAPAPAQIAAPEPTPVVPPVAALPSPAVASVPLATEAEILAHRAERLTLFRLAQNPAILVFDFPGLREQGLMFDRIAAFAEKVGVPHDRLLTDAELERAIRAHGDTIETYYYGHDYSAETLRRFFALADRDHIRLSPDEERLRAILTEQGLLADGAVGALISVPREGADALVDASFRRTILHHELSHGEYFTNPAYAAYAHRFWDTAMSEPTRAAFRRFLLGQDYDPALTDLTVNETQAYLMHTADRRAFSAEALGLSEAALNRLQANFLLGMPPGWLRDCTTVPPVAATRIADPAPAAKVPRQRSTVRTRTACTAIRPPRRSAAAIAA